VSAGIELQETPEGIRLRLRVKPGARKNAILGAHAGALKIAVVAAAEKGRANEAVLDLLCEALAIPRSSLRLVSGAASRDKAVLVRLPRPVIEERLAARRG